MGWGGQGLQFLGAGLLLEGRQLLVAHPVDAIDGTGIDRFLDPLSAVAVLANGAGAAPVFFHQKGVGGHMGAVAAADTDRLIHPNRFLPQCTTEHRLTA